MTGGGRPRFRPARYLFVQPLTLGWGDGRDLVRLLKGGAVFDAQPLLLRLGAGRPVPHAGQQLGVPLLALRGGETGSPVAGRPHGGLVFFGPPLAVRLQELRPFGHALVVVVGELPACRCLGVHRGLELAGEPFTLLLGRDPVLAADPLRLVSREPALHLVLGLQRFSYDLPNGEAGVERPDRVLEDHLDVVPPVPELGPFERQDVPALEPDGPARGLVKASHDPP